MNIEKLNETGRTDGWTVDYYCMNG